ncbi:MAG: DUF4965 domain-containing protein [Prevotella sp.]|nr:DUF4965 domain-containing protein [Prevotella sp.]
MKRLLTIAIVLMGALGVHAQQAEYFKPYKTTELRLPSVPIVVNDPYFSIWSSYDKLTDGPTNYWYSRDLKKPIDGLLRVDGETYRFMGTQRNYILGNTLLPMADESAWEAPGTRTKQTGTGWTAEDFDDSSWETLKGAIGTGKEYKNVRTEWSGENTDVYVRRHLALSAADLEKDLYAMYSHDDVFELYLNGHRIVSTGETWNQGVTLQLTSAMKGYLHEGDNTIAAHCHNTTGGALLDFGIYENIITPAEGIKVATQKDINVLATNTYYTMACGPVELDLVFTAPMLIDDLELLSTPINYISYQVRATDNQEHDVQIYFAASPEITVYNTNAGVTSKNTKSSGINYLSTGNTSQGFHETGSWEPIDWGYLYLPSFNGEVSLCETNGTEQYFADEGALPKSKSTHRATKGSQYPTLAYMHNFGKVSATSSFMMIGYDEVNDIQFMGKKYKGFWARNKKNIYKAFTELNERYDEIMTRCKELDKRIYDDGEKAGNTKYAELLSGCYRHCIAAHKLFQDEDGDTLFFSRENDSGGFINTVDLTYPESPIFLMYNHELQKAMITSIFKYCQSDRWGFNFAAHDLGHYPIADNQHYSIRFPNASGGFEGNMPLEESGNIVTLVATISMLDGNTNYADRFWDTITTWTDYLAENGQDPENQLCTDDFAGHLAHNANLSLKAIYGVAGYALMCKIKGDMDNYNKYMDKAKAMITQWESDARASDGKHYNLTLDGNDNTWSQKYNMVWDKLWRINIMPNNAISTEMTYYRTKQNTYGLPLDSRSAYSKSDWIMWTAAMSSSKSGFQLFADRVYKYANETKSRVPMSDWYWTNNANMQGFRARSVVGGHWMKVFMDNFDPDVPHSTGVANVVDKSANATEVARYNANGQRVSSAQKGLNIVKYSDGSTKKIVIK